jgi:septal ring factor EnvC (AmiA/AmiB activator)
MRYWCLIMAVAAELSSRGAVLAADPRFPDWPCNQIKVPEISIAAVWTGPPIDDVESTWQADPAVVDLVARLAARRTPLEEAEKAISEFIRGDAAEREQKAKLIFAGLLQSLNQERSRVMNGIERFSRLQKGFADKIRSENRELRDLQNSADRDQAKADELAERIDWDSRIFEERHRTISYVCEVPVLIEQRLFALAREIQQALE